MFFVCLYIVVNIAWNYKIHIQLEKLESRVNNLNNEFAKLERAAKFELSQTSIYVSRRIGSYSSQEYVGKFEEVFMAIVKHLNITRTPDVSGRIQFKSKDE